MFGNHIILQACTFLSTNTHFVDTFEFSGSLQCVDPADVTTCFLLGFGTTNWIGAAQFCADNFGEIASIFSAAENAVATVRMQSPGNMQPRIYAVPTLKRN